MLPTNIKMFEKLGRVARRGWLFLEINKPSVMTGLAMGGAIILTGSSAKSAIETYKVKDQIKDLDFAGKAKVIIPLWAETAIILAFVEIMIFGANQENARRIAELAAAFSLSEKNLKEYQEKAEELIGEKKVRQIEDSIAKDYAKNESLTDTIFDTGHGTTLFKELSTGRKFYNDRNFIEAKVNELNNELNSHGPASDNPDLYFVTKNDLFKSIGLEEVDGGDTLGWNSFNGNLIKLSFTSEQLPDKVNYITYIRLEDMSPTFTDEYEYNNR